MPFDLTVLTPHLDALLAGAALTAEVCGLGIAGAFALATMLGLAAVGESWAGRLARLYVDVFRNVPFVVQVFFLFYGLPEVGVYIDAFWTGVLALGLVGGAYGSDVVRSGILAIEPGVVEAAKVSGLSRLAIISRVVLPIALRTAIRPLGSVFVNLVLSSSILSMITLDEVTGTARGVASETYRPFEVYAFLLAAYAGLTYAVSLAINALHRRLNRHMMTSRTAGKGA
ncbi:amino acid ABC transporter permease [Nitrospirillum bahiense]|uniref:Polar amino acid transport system permease protein/putative glutamine transport system permease protein n=1 Tax=Nitrospirillum amazonense TaxID=28077 RepID=A0A560FYY2_9PROT|nr:amino acid ABC transporter permease [Nitrospirillum amazonense]TWB26844.1 polar amino acid transport system permease protein/putative glutamine transport system permease protein [Nitrospirillum amazonense]